jgi:hypothetical protein
VKGGEMSSKKREEERKAIASLAMLASKMERENFVIIRHQLHLC